MIEVLLLLVALGLTPACAVSVSVAGVSVSVSAEGALRAALGPTARRPAVRLPGSRPGTTATSPLGDTLTASPAAGSRPAAVPGGSGSVPGHVTARDVLDEPVGPAAAV
ncbi:hypothetical protein ACFV14_18360 [Streptomyces zaomyceticus]|uniref:hypothetical protein n=1 Tax=Streptomyces zaomyceticus TaxID=68286 RepID=UPI0036790A6B